METSADVSDPVKPPEANGESDDQEYQYWNDHIPKDINVVSLSTWDEVGVKILDHLEVVLFYFHVGEIPAQPFII